MHIDTVEYYAVIKMMVVYARVYFHSFPYCLLGLNFIGGHNDWLLLNILSYLFSLSHRTCLVKPHWLNLA